MVLSFNNEIPLNTWREFAFTNPHSNPFQTPEFYSTFNSVPGFSCEAVAITQDEKILSLAILTIQKESGIKGWFSRRGIIYGGPLIDINHPEAFDLLLTGIEKVFARLSIYTESRNLSDYKHFNIIFTGHNWKYIPYTNITLKLEGTNLKNILAGMKYNRRREISLSIDGGAVYRECQTYSELKILYGLLSDLYLNRIKLPLPDYLFFEKMWQFYYGKIFIVIHNNKLIGGSFCFIQPAKAIYTMYYCGIRNYHKKIFPTHLAILAAIEYGINNGLQYLDFMGTGIRGEEYGVRRYKQEFGGESADFGRHRKINSRLLYHIGKAGLRLLR